MVELIRYLPVKLRRDIIFAQEVELFVTELGEGMQCKFSG